MADVSNEPAWRESIEQKIDGLSVRVERGFASVDEGFADQRKYTEFAFEQLRGEIKTEVSALRADLRTEMTGMRGDIGRLERKLDRVLDTLSGTNVPPRRRRS